MEAAHTSARTENAAAHGSERKCLVTGEVRPKEDLIRFVVGPENSIVPDLAQNLPGRGLWVTADHQVIQSAVQKNLFSRAAKTPVRADPDLAGQVVQIMRRRCLELMGLARRAGIAVLGQPQVEAALKARKLTLLLVADDASQIIENRAGIKENRTFTRNELGATFGHDQIVYAGLKPQPLTKKLIAELARLEKLNMHSHISKDSEQR